MPASTLGAMEEYLVEVSELHSLTADVVELTVRLIAPESITFKAGQCMHFKIADQLRSYSITNPPAQENPVLKFCIKLEPVGVGSDFVRKLTPGQTFTMLGATGDLTVEQDPGRDLFFIANGVGIAPFCSLVPDVLGRGYSNTVHLLYGLRNEENVFYFQKFNELLPLHPNFTFIPILSQPEAHWPGETGRVTTYLDVSYPAYRNSIFYIAGSLDMVKDCRKILLDKGHPSKDIIVEYFN